MKAEPILKSLVLIITFLAALPASAQLIPSYTQVFKDETMVPVAIQNVSTRHWLAPQGADNYAMEKYERPTNQTYRYRDGKYVTDGDYFGNLDIAEASYGYDQTYVYVRIQLVDTYLRPKSGSIKNEGLVYEYRFRINTDPTGAYGYLFVSDAPSTLGTSFRGDKTFVYHDTNGNVAGTADGYENKIVSDGKHDSSGKSVFFARIDPMKSSAVEFAVDYKALGLNPAAISSIVFEANKGLKGPSNYTWNKVYTESEAGSPNGGDSGESEFGTSGLGNVYELDTLWGWPNGGGDSQQTTHVVPTGSLSIPKTIYLRGTTVPVGYSIKRGN